MILVLRKLANLYSHVSYWWNQREWMGKEQFSVWNRGVCQAEDHLIEHGQRGWNVWKGLISTRPRSSRENYILPHEKTRRKLLWMALRSVTWLVMNYNSICRRLNILRSRISSDHASSLNLPVKLIYYVSRGLLNSFTATIRSLAVSQAAYTNLSGRRITYFSFTARRKRCISYLKGSGRPCQTLTSYSPTSTSRQVSSTFSLVTHSFRSCHMIKYVASCMSTYGV